MKCRIHPKQTLTVKCMACLGSITSKAKAKSSRANGKLGGRPRKRTRKPKLRAA